MELHSSFARKMENLPKRLKELLDMPIRRKGETWPSDKVSGVYLFSEAGMPLYVGRSRNIKGRFRAHTTLSHNSGSFAFRIARETTGMTQATYRPDGSRANLQDDPRFRAAFLDAIERVKAMDFQFVVESDPVSQCLLEVYCSLALGTQKYNSFDTH